MATEATDVYVVLPYSDFDIEHVTHDFYKYHNVVMSIHSESEQPCPQGTRTSDTIELYGCQAMAVDCCLQSISFVADISLF